MITCFFSRKDISSSKLA